MIDQFFIIGAQRSGTTWAYKMLEQHPEVVMAKPMRPEPKYFLRDDVSTENLAAYEKAHYAKRDGYVCGEKSTSYIESRTAAARIAANYPDAHILVLLRDPIERAISNFRFSTRLGFETDTIEHAFLHEDERRDEFDMLRVSSSPFAYLRRGEYIRYLRVYREFFPTAQMHLFSTEQVVGNRAGIRLIFASLGVDADFLPTGISATINSIQDETKIEISDSLRETLRHYFLPANEALATEFGFDLSMWRNFQ